MHVVCVGVVMHVCSSGKQWPHCLLWESRSAYNNKQFGCIIVSDHDAAVSSFLLGLSCVCVLRTPAAGHDRQAVCCVPIVCVPLSFQLRPSLLPLVLCDLPCLSLFLPGLRCTVQRHLQLSVSTI